MLMMSPDMPVMRFAEGDAVVSEEEKKRFRDFQPEGMLKGTIFDYVPDKTQTMSFMMDRMGMGQPEPVQEENSFDMLKMFMELTPEEKMMVAGPNFNEMTEDEIGMAMYNFISEGRGLSGGREVDYMDPDKQGLAGGGIVSLMDDDYWWHLLSTVLLEDPQWTHLVPWWALVLDPIYSQAECLFTHPHPECQCLAEDWADSVDSVDSAVTVVEWAEVLIRSVASLVEWAEVLIRL